MATYNGAKYIENQILSILQQTHKDWNLYIHDDEYIDNLATRMIKWIENNRIEKAENERD